MYQNLIQTSRTYWEDMCQSFQESGCLFLKGQISRNAKKPKRPKHTYVVFNKLDLFSHLLLD